MIAADPSQRAIDWLHRQATIEPGRRAVTDPDSDTTYTYDDLDARAAAVAAGLAGLGVGHGDRVATLAGNGVEILDLLFGCGRLGAVLVPLNWRLAEREITALMADVEPTVVLADEPYLEVARRTAGAARVLSMQADFPALLRMDGHAPSVDVSLSDPWLILYTGGTTGLPKGAILTHGSILWNAINTAISWGLSARDAGPSFTPMFHTGGLNVFTLPLLLLGGQVILPRRFDPAQALEILRDPSLTIVFMVPTMFGLVAEHPDFPDIDLSHLRWAISGGAPLPREIARPWKAKVPAFKQGYGLTEVGPNNFATSDEDALRGMDHTVGKLTVFAQARIVGSDGHDLPNGEVGELLLAGPHMCAGYWRRPEATAEAIRDGWFHTGDLACRDTDGYYRIVDRKKDMIITGGENVYPVEVESVLYSHPAVREAAVVGIPDPKWGEAVTALVTLRDGFATDPDTLRAFCRQNLAGYKSPKAVHIVSELPKSAAGKILRAAARQLLDAPHARPD